MPASIRIPANGPAQEGIAERYERRRLVMVLAVTVPSGRKFVEMRLVAHGLQLCGHFSSMARMYPVVAPARCDQDWWIRVARRRDVIRGNDREEFPVLWLVGIAVFVSNRRTDEK